MYHPRIQKFLDLKERKAKEIKLYCEFIQLKSEIEDDIILLKLDFLDPSHNYTELLILEIELDSLYQSLSKAEQLLISIEAKIENIKLQMDTI